jgi:hypothetical protein
MDGRPHPNHVCIFGRVVENLDGFDVTCKRLRYEGTNHDDAASRKTWLGAIMRAAALALAAALLTSPVEAQYKAEFKMSRVQDVYCGQRGNSLGPGGHPASRGSPVSVSSSQTSRRRNLCSCNKAALDFAIGSTINWSQQVKELNLFAMPFLFPSYRALDAVEAGGPGSACSP